MSFRAAPTLALLLGCAAAPAPPEVDPGLAELTLDGVHPGLLLPGTPIDLTGSHFVGEADGLAHLRLDGTFTATTGAARAVAADADARFVDEGHLVVDATSGIWTAIGGEPGRFTGEATLSIDSALDHRSHAAPPIDVGLDLAATLAPRLDAATGGAVYVNSAIALRGDGFLLGGSEGETRAVLDGCFLPAGMAGPCAGRGVTVKGAVLVARPTMPWDRQNAAFVLAPSLVGIHPGSFSGVVTLRNVFSDGPSSSSRQLPLALEVQKPALQSFSPQIASLGQWVEIVGGGFVGGAPGQVTLVHLVGSFAVSGGPTRPVDLELVPHFESGGHLRYVLDEADDLGHRIDLRQIAGTFSGTAQPVVIADGQQQLGDAVPAQLAVAHVKQVVYLSFSSSYQTALRRFGLLAADAPIRARVLAVAARDYAGVNVDFRLTAPSDFALYAQVDVVGPDPNGLGLLGYDNTPGKDVGNARLFDRVGGVNATTQQDGFPGYGGVFAENFLGFSAHPPANVEKLPIGASLFDAIFDPLRPDTSGRAASSSEVAALAPLVDGGGCPAASDDRPGQVGCAIFVLGNLIGTTLTHETGHSLGLANPYGDGFHDVGDLPNRLMEAGGDRPFEERAEIAGQGPGRFCDSEFTYLQGILPSVKDPGWARPPCTN